MPLLVPRNLGEMAIRLAVALLIGAVIGLERESRDKAAGVRTYALVSFNVAFLVLVSSQISVAQQSSQVLDRIIQGIVIGIGFIGSGMIVHHSRSLAEESSVEGLTSAATVWITAALAIAAGCGLWQLAMIGAGFSLLILRVFKQLEES